MLKKLALSVHTLRPYHFSIRFLRQSSLINKTKWCGKRGCTDEAQFSNRARLYRRQYNTLSDVMALGQNGTLHNLSVNSTPKK